MRKLLSTVVLLIVVFLIKNADGHATDMLSRCSTPLTVGTTIMGRSAASSTSRTVIVKRGTTTLNSGDTYIFGETLTVTLSSTAAEYNLETAGGKFTGGSCSSRRLAGRPGSLVMPSSGTTTVTVWGGWTSSQSTVYISSSFVLVAPPVTATPTVAPTISLSPTTIAPTQPTYAPSTASPTISFAPTEAPTEAPTNPASSKTSPVSAGTVKAIVGTIIGAIGTLGVVLLGYYYSGRVVEGSIDRIAVNALIVRLVAAIACLLSIVTIIVMARWAKDNSTVEGATDVMYLGTPSWSTTQGLLAYHPVLMTSGFFVAQIFAIAVWAFTPARARDTTKLLHVICQTIGLATMIAGYVSIMDYQEKQGLVPLTTMHAWIGVMAVAVFALTYLWGAVMALLLLYFPQSLLRQGIDLRSHHRKLGVFALILSLAAVLTGIMNQLPQGQCTVANAGYSTDASKYYPDIPLSCRLGQGVGVLVTLATMFVLWGMTDRGAIPIAPGPPKSNKPTNPTGNRQSTTVVPVSSDV